MSELTPAQITKEFKRAVPKGPIIMCKHCGYKIGHYTRPTVTKERLAHLNECKKFDVFKMPIIGLKVIHKDEAEEDPFPREDEIKQPNEHDDSFDDMIMFILLMCVFQTFTLCHLPL